MQMSMTLSQFYGIRQNINQVIYTSPTKWNNSGTNNLPEKKKKNIGLLSFQKEPIYDILKL